MLKHLLPLNPKVSCGEKGKRLGVVEKDRDEMDSDPQQNSTTPHQILYCLQHFVSGRGKGAGGKKKKKSHVVLFTDAILRLRGFCLESLICSLWLLDGKVRVVRVW